ncbi:hypothetical protein [Komagataeibacter saccharivorans]|uniref:hypothetical protein n=1 Tax=Komagataeibacter saccharivorans TaxID=265959 RepID=UPI0039EBCB3C
MVYRIDDTTAVSTLPALPTDNISTPGYFTGGSTGGQAATRVRFWWLNMVQEELATVVLAAGLVLNKSNNGQVLAAIQKLISAAVSDLDTALSAMIDNCVAGNWALGTTGYQVVGMNCQISDLRPAFFYVDGNKTQQAGGRLGLYTDITALQTSLTAEQATRADQVASLTASVDTKISGNGDPAYSDAFVVQISYRPSYGTVYANYEGGAVTLASSVQLNALQTNLTAFQAQQADQNSTFSSDIASRVQTNANNDGTNAPITLLNFFLETGMLWFSANGIQSNVAQTNPGDGWNAIKNITVENDDGTLTVLDTTGKTNTYQPCSANIQSDTVSVTKMGDLVIQTFEASISNANNGGAGSAVVQLPQALTEAILFTSGNALGGTQGATDWIPSVNVFPTSLTEVTIYADNLQNLNWTQAVTVKVLVVGS